MKLFQSFIALQVFDGNSLPQNATTSGVSQLFGLFLFDYYKSLFLDLPLGPVPAYNREIAPFAFLNATFFENRNFL